MLPLIPLLTVLPSLVSSIAGLVKGDQAEKIQSTAQTITQVVGDLTEGRLPPEQVSALEQATNTMRVELAQINLEEVKALLADQTNARGLIEAESKSEDPWVRRARPFFLWIMYGVMGWNFMVLPTLQWLRQAPMSPVVLPDSLYYLFGAGFLGYGTLRSFDKGSLSFPWSSKSRQQ